MKRKYDVEVKIYRSTVRNIVYQFVSDFQWLPMRATSLSVNRAERHASVN